MSLFSSLLLLAISLSGISVDAQTLALQDGKIIEVLQNSGNGWSRVVDFPHGKEIRSARTKKISLLSSDACAFLFERRLGPESKSASAVLGGQQSWMLHHIQQNYITKRFPEGKSSMNISREFFFTRDSRHDFGDIISYGSGPDVYRPLIDFPLARRYHLVDLLTGWGHGPLMVLGEIKRRLEHLDPNALVKTVRWGFLNELSRGVRDGLNSISRSTTQENYLSFIERSSIKSQLVKISTKSPSQTSPWQIRVTWPTENFGTMSKDFFVHPKDFNSEAHSEALFEEVKELRGIVITGTGFPNNFEQIQKKLLVGGAMVLETYDYLRERRLVDQMKDLREYADSHLT